jgi:N-acetylmuramoyl-L-alanine amidase CwlA
MLLCAILYTDKRTQHTIPYKRKENIMRFRVYHRNSKWLPTYFRTKKEAVEFMEEHGGEIQRKIGGNWFGY